MSDLGNVIVKVGSVDYLNFQGVESDGVTPINITGVSEVRLELVNDLGVSKNFSDLDNPQKLFITNASTCEIQLRPLTTDFSEKERYKGELVFVDSVGPHNVPSNSYISFTVVEK